MVEVALEQIGPYTNIRLLNQSSTGRTYLGKYQQRKKYVVIKLFRTPFDAPEAREVFLAHAKKLKKLKHRNIAEIQDAGFIAGTSGKEEYGYHVIQYVLEDENIKRLAVGQQNKAEEVKRIVSIVADALNYAHQTNTLHGNIHPGNLLFAQNSDILLTDFAPMPQTQEQSDIRLMNIAGRALPYMAPEQLRGMPVAASDQYALAVMAYERLCGRRPYTATQLETLLQQQEHEPVPIPHTLNTNISPGVEQVLLRALALHAEDRFPNIQKFADAYLRALMGFPVAEDEEMKHAAIRYVEPISTSQDRINRISKEREGTGALILTPKNNNEMANDNSIEQATMNRAPTATLDEMVVEAAPAPESGDEASASMQVDAPESTDNDKRSQILAILRNGQTSLSDIVTADLRQGGVLSRSLPGYEERPAQVEMATLVAHSLTEYKHAIIEAGTGTGKALDVDTPIPTPSGWKRMGDLVKGDFVFDEKGYPTRVTAAFEVMYDHKCYEVEFSDGSSIIADAEHEWVSYTVADRKRGNHPLTSTYAAKNFVTFDQLTALDQLIAQSQNGSICSVDEATRLIGGHRWSVFQEASKMMPINPGERPARYPRQVLLTAARGRLARDFSEQHRDGRMYTLVTTKQMAATLTVGSHGRANHAIPVASSLVLPDTDLPIAPYFLGFWLGDGNSRNNQITTADPTLITEIEKEGYTVRPLKSNRILYAVDDENGKATNRWQPGMTGRLRALGLYLNKHIPTAYLRASEQQRRALLAGLLDTDGTVSHCGAVEFTTTNPQLAQDVFELVCSLGFRPTLRSGCARYRGKDCGPKWTVAFTTNEEVFRLERKTTTQKECLSNYNPKRNRFRYVVAVREVPSRPVRCIQVDSESHLYLAGRSMIPTHNSLAYLIPIVRSGKVAIISTANKALQEQLYFKDIPFVQKHIQHFDAALVKGMANYVCLDRLEEERNGIQHLVKNRDFMRLVDLVNDPDAGFTGDFETLDFPLPADIRSKVYAERDQCTWAKCNFFKDCYVRKMKVKAGHAQVIVVNHTLLLIDAALEGFLLPDRDVIIVDEAHHLEEEATRAFTVTISQGRVSTLLAQRLLKDHSSVSLQEEAKQTMVIVWERLFQVADPGYKGRANLVEPLEEGLGLATVIDKLVNSLRQQRPKNMPEKEDQLYDMLISRAKNLAADLRTVFSVGYPDKFVYYAERVNAQGRRGGQLEVSAAPLEVSSWLQKQLFDKCKVIGTSATLATIGPNPVHPEDRGPNFAYFRRRVGLDHLIYPDVQERILPLAFDYEHNAVLYIPRHLPEPVYGSGPEAIRYMKSITHEMMKLVEASRGRAFLLFSSKRMLEDVYNEFCQLLPSHLDYPLLRQGDMTRLELTRTFRETEGAVLFGLKSFWEGVDIAGEALSLVVIDKLPFDPPDDPVHEARVTQMKAAGENWFGLYVLPQAVLRLKQGLGRLLRTHEDRGVMAILDTRLHTKGYGKLVVNALPPAHRTSSLRDVERFFAQ